jgi:type I restriction enzyme S subunit
MLNLNPTIVGRMSVPAPPLLEQTKIMDFIRSNTSKIDCMIQKVESAIKKLTEYRTALITAAVTGKIDVRKPR